MVWVPAHQAHAIERVNVLLQFSEPIPAKQMTAILADGSLKFPAVGFNSQNEESGEFNIQLGPDGPSIAFGQAGLAIGSGQQIQQSMGRVFRRIEGNEVREELSINRTRVLYSSTRYESWSAYLARLRRLLDETLAKALVVASIQLLKLEYWDRFTFEGKPEDADFTQLFRQESVHLPKFPFDAGRLWHSHIGYYAPDMPQRKRLINLNVDVLDLVIGGPNNMPVNGQTKRSAGIYSMAQDTRDPTRLIDDSDTVSQVLTELHSDLISILHDILTPTAKDRISLKTH